MNIRGLRISTLALLLLAAPGIAGAQKMKQPASEAPVPVEASTGPGPNSVLDDIQHGWMSQDADLILRHFGPNKVVISLDGSEPGGSYSKDQGHYVFKELFNTTVTKKFVFVKIRKSNNEGTTLFAIAERRYQRRDDGRQVKDKVYVALHHEDPDEGGRWVLDEIKTIR